MKLLEINNLKKSFDNLDVLHDISLSVEEGEVVAIIGPSGSGKSTLLRCATLLETMDAGEMTYLDQRAVTTVDGRAQYADSATMKTVQSYFGLVFQNFNLFPHYSVLKNITDAPLHVQKRDKAEVMETAASLIRKMGLEGKEGYYPCQLSGGQQQRVALARIMASDPAVIMLDEPLSALDSFLHWQLELKLSRILREYSGTTIYVSHNRDEVYRLCDRVCVINEGHSEPVKTVSEFFDAPPTLAAAILSGCKNFSRIEIIDSRRLRASDWNMTFTSAHLIPDEARYVGVRAHYLIPVAERERDENTMRAEIIEVRDDVFSAIITVRPNETKSESNFAVIRIELSKELAKNYRAGETIYLKVAPSDVMPLLP